MRRGNVDTPASWLSLLGRAALASGIADDAMVENEGLENDTRKKEDDHEGKAS